MNYFKKTLAAVVAGGTLIFGGNALADVADDSMWTFRNAYVTAPQNDRAFNSSVIFFGTTFHSELDAGAQVLKDASMRVKGNLNWEYTNPQTKRTSNITMPFYIRQDGGNETTVFVQRNGKWNKFVMAGFSAGLVNAIKTTNLAELQQNIDAVKTVDIFRDTATQQIFNITLDGNKVAQMFQTFERQSPTNFVGSELESHQNFVRNLINALNETDISCTWTVDKQTKETVALNIDFTALMRAYAKSMLDESAAGTIVLTDEERDLMDTLGYYSEFHFSISSNNQNQKLDLTFPKAAQKAITDSGVLDDVIKDLTTAR